MTHARVDLTQFCNHRVSVTAASLRSSTVWPGWLESILHKNRFDTKDDLTAGVDLITHARVDSQKRTKMKLTVADMGIDPDVRVVLV